MTEDNKEHKPVLLPEEQGLAYKNKEHHAILLPADQPRSAKPPYLLIALILFGIIGAFWKMAVRKEEPVGDHYEALRAQEKQHFTEKINARDASRR